MTARVAIWNPVSGSAPEEAELTRMLGDDVRLVETTEDDPGTGQTADAVNAGAEIVIACGGDGTVRACLQPLAETPASLAIIPLGTGNLLASNLGIPSGLDAADGIGKGPRTTIDLGTVNGETFAVMAGSGFDAHMIGEANDDLKARVGTAAYVLSGARNLRADTVGTTITIDGRVWFEGRSTMVLVGNFGEISGGLAVFPKADPADGKLDIAVVSASNFREWIAVGWRILRRKPLASDLARRTQGRSIEVKLRRARAYELDGEARDPVDHLEFGIEQDALSLHHQPVDTASAPPKAST